MNVEKNDLDFLRKAVVTNSVILFLGAGFSADATNRAGSKMPVGEDFARLLWTFLGYSGDFDGVSLPNIFDAALAKTKHSDLQQCLNQHFLSSAVPDWYSLVAQFFWARIYGTNVDDVVEHVYGRARVRQQLKIFNAITDDYEERDPFLEKLQYVKLNGTLTETPKSVTFSTRQYAARLTDQDAWYDQFVRDYSTRVTIFIGTKLNEPLLYRSIEARGKRYPGGEHRPRSFVICRSFSPVDVDNLRAFNVVPITGTAKEFLELLVKECSPLPSLEQVLLKTNPGFEGMVKIMAGRMSERTKQSLQVFYSNFRPVSVPSRIAAVRKLYLQGAEPQWGDILNDLDAPRELNNDLLSIAQKLHTQAEPGMLAIAGSAGSGKSTILKRMAMSLSSLGHLVFFSDCEQLPETRVFETAIDSMPERPYVFFDNANLALGYLSHYLEAIKRSGRKATLVVAGPSHPLLDRVDEWKQHNCVEDRRIADLSERDIDSIIERLDQHNLLGKLAGRSPHEQRQVFLQYAKRQILIAMRAATLGPGFDEIIKNEFLHVSPTEAQIVYLSAAIASSAQFSVTIQQLVSCSQASPAETLAYIHGPLRDVLIPAAPESEVFHARHRVIAEYIVDQFAPRLMLRESYIRLLKTLSHNMKYPVDTKSRTFRLYRTIINHASIFRHFRSNIELARSIYGELAPHLKRDFHFWLQYGSLELEYGELSEAANYLEQAYALSPDDDFVLTTKAQLRYRQACSASLFEKAVELRDEARAILNAQMQRRPFDNYPVHIYCAQELAWLSHWLPFAKDKQPALEELKEFANLAQKSHPFCTEIKDVVKKINEAYLDLAKPKH
jgi:hypothetical protein